MIRFDNELFHMARENPIKVPISVSISIEQTLKNLAEKNNEPSHNKPKRNNWILTSKIAFASLIMILFILPNIFPSIAHSMGSLPIIGTIVKVFTIREYDYDDGYHKVDIEVPSVNVETLETMDNNIDDSINASIEELTDTLLNEFNREYVGTEGYGSLDITYDVITNNNNWFTLRITVLETAASSNTYYKFYHVEKLNGQISELSDLFKDNSNYIEAISNDIYKQMLEQSKEDDSIIYFISEDFSEEQFHSIKANQNFYFAKNGNLVIAFDKYDVAPGMMGCPEFEIDETIYSGYLKQKY